MALPGMDEVGLTWRDAVDSARTFVEQFQPDVIVIFAPDHMNLLARIRPPFTGILSGSTLPEFSIPEFDLNIPEQAPEVYAEVVANGLDLAVGENVQADHGLGLTLVQMFDRPDSVPLIPIIVNAIGFPLFPVRRAAQLGTAVGRAVCARFERTLFVGTGGMSHNPPFPEPRPGAVRFTPAERKASLASALNYVDPDWDRAILAGMSAGRSNLLSSLSQADLDVRGGGSNEVRTWAAAWAAAGCQPAAYTAYELVEEWITGMGVAYG